MKNRTMIKMLYINVQSIKNVTVQLGEIQPFICYGQFSLLVDVKIKEYCTFLVWLSKKYFAIIKITMKMVVYVALQPLVIFVMQWDCRIIIIRIN